MKGQKMEGWVETTDGRIFEIEADLGNMLLGREVLYKQATYKLYYGEREVIGKGELMNGT